MEFRVVKVSEITDMDLEREIKNWFDEKKEIFSNYPEDILTDKYIQENDNSRELLKYFSDILNEKLKVETIQEHLKKFVGSDFIFNENPVTNYTPINKYRSRYGNHDVELIKWFATVLYNKDSLLCPVVGQIFHRKYNNEIVWVYDGFLVDRYDEKYLFGSQFYPSISKVSYGKIEMMFDDGLGVSMINYSDKKVEFYNKKSDCKEVFEIGHRKRHYKVGYKSDFLSTPVPIYFTRSDGARIVFDTSSPSPKIQSTPVPIYFTRSDGIRIPSYTEPHYYWNGYE